ncbi:MAG: GNAT family N-acetyltransferase [Pyrinomonadaceae bacterium]
MNNGGSRVEIAVAEVSDCAELTELALRSKAHWGYDAEFLEACRDDLTVSEAIIAGDDSYAPIARIDGRLAGFALLLRTGNLTGELEFLFIDPRSIGFGLGRELFNACLKQGKLWKLERIKVVSDPNASGFYESMGAVRCGEEASSSVRGRVLPIYEFRFGVSEDSSLLFNKESENGV